MSAGSSLTPADLAPYHYKTARLGRAQLPWAGFYSGKLRIGRKIKIRASAVFWPVRPTYFYRGKELYRTRLDAFFRELSSLNPFFLLESNKLPDQILGFLKVYLFLFKDVLDKYGLSSKIYTPQCCNKPFSWVQITYYVHHSLNMCYDC